MIRVTRNIQQNLSLSCCSIEKKKIKRLISKYNKASSTINTHTTSSKYFNVRTQIILVLCCVYMFSYEESKSTASYVLLSMNMMDEYFKLCI